MPHDQKMPAHPLQWGECYPAPGHLACAIGRAPGSTEPALLELIEGHWKIDLRGHVVISAAEHARLRAAAKGEA